MSPGLKTVFSPDVQPLKYGNKAYWLSWLARSGFNVPYAVFLPVEQCCNSTVAELKESTELRRLMQPLVTPDGQYDVAIRSSATCEDTEEQSLAGHFLSVLGTMVLEDVLIEVDRVKESLRDAPCWHSCRMGVIVQKRIPAEFSGVVFSSNPLSSAKNETVLSVVRGPGHNLVSGKSAGEDILLALDEELKISEHNTGLSESCIRQLYDCAKLIELRVGKPVDLEWCLDQQGELHLLQCRPIVRDISHFEGVVQVCLANRAVIPPVAAPHDKVELRLEAEKSGIEISKAYIVTTLCERRDQITTHLHSIRPTDNCVGYSVVLIYPSTLRGRVMRRFSGRASLATAVGHLMGEVCDSFWDAIALVQEIFEPEYTGILKRVGDYFILEIARGHFVPKGLVPCSRYVIDRKGGIIYRREVHQSYCFRIEGGQIRQESLPGHLTRATLKEAALKEIVNAFSVLLDSESTILEFGLLSSTNVQTGICPYLIDSVSISSSVNIPIDSIATGVISNGRVKGKLIYLELNGSIDNSLEAHFHDQLAFSSDEEEGRVFLCERPDISLLEVLRHCNPKRLGFIFRQASVLCHLAIVLREQGIPAIQIEDWTGLIPGQVVRLDTIKAPRTPKGSLTKL